VSGKIERYPRYGSLSSTISRRQYRIVTTDTAGPAALFLKFFGAIGASKCAIADQFTREKMAENQDQLKAKLTELEIEHRDLDDVINSLAQKRDFDQIKMSRLKKRKLGLKDQISSLQDRLIPDIIA